MRTNDRVSDPAHAGAGAGVEGNARLTSVNAMVLLALLAVEGFTILRVRQMITLHVFLGILLIGPVLLKTGSTMYRFARYYTGSQPYLDKGPPHPLLRLFGPLVIVSSLAVLGTGVGLLTVARSHRGAATGTPSQLRRLVGGHDPPRPRTQTRSRRHVTAGASSGRRRPGIPAAGSAVRGHRARPGPRRRCRHDPAAHRRTLDIRHDQPPPSWTVNASPGWRTACRRTDPLMSTRTHARARPVIAGLLATAILTVLTSCVGAPGSPARHGAVTRGPASPTLSPPSRHAAVTRGPARSAASPPVGHDLTAVVEPWHLPGAVSREVVLVDHRRLVVAGGLAAAGSSTAIVRIDPGTGTASGSGKLARPVHDAAGVTLGGRHYVFGGGAQATVATVQEFGSDGSAVVVGRLPRPRSDLVAAVAGSTAYVLGGYDGATTDPAVLATTDGRHFAMVARLPVAVRYPAVAGLGHTLYLFGGEHAGSPTTAIQRVDIHTGTAALVGHLPHPLAHASALTLGGTVYLLGGVTATSADEGITRFNPTTDVVVPAGRLPYPVSDAGVAVLDGTAYLVGGENPHPLGTVIALHVE